MRCVHFMVRNCWWGKAFKKMNKALPGLHVMTTKTLHLLLRELCEMIPNFPWATSSSASSAPLPLPFLSAHSSRTGSLGLCWSLCGVSFFLHDVGSCI